jgi:uncharacterized protein YbjT (DUF2867 family)
MILITGASGTVGRAVLEEILKSGQPAKAMYREANDAKTTIPDLEAVVADFADKSSLERGLRGVDVLFLVCSPIPELVELESNVIDVAKEIRVKHIVLNSALGAGDYPKSFPSWHRKVEERLKASGLSYTILRPNSFMQNIVAFFAPSIRAQGAFYVAMGEAKLSFIDVRDIAAITAKTLASPQGYAGKIYELNGPEAVTYSQVAEKISRTIGSAVRFVDISEDAQRKSMLDLGMPEWQVTALLDLQCYYSVGRKGGEVTGVTAQLLGRPPITLDQFLQENKDSFRSHAAVA